jgi:hypothetical protein
MSTLGAISSQFLAIWSVKQQILSERSEFICCSAMSLKLQKWPRSTNAGGMLQLLRNKKRRRKKGGVMF